MNSDNPEVLRQKLEQFLCEQDGATWCRYGQFAVGTAFQKIFSVDHSVVGVEALARPFIDGQPCSPLELIATATDKGENIFLDRMLRAVHLRNFARLNKPARQLYLNHDLQALIESEANMATRALYQARIMELGLTDTEIVVEILEHEASCEDALALVSRNRRAIERELLALDDVTDCELVYQRCQRIEPDIIKLDISVLAYPNYAAFVAQVRRPGLVIVQEGIETQAELERASQHCDLLQGFYLHRPQLATDF
ncbi:EAL domain-containing protein [Salinibius halmophilus]|uniref:EAL domain-containing protein n=1 Tax=Salinibius halmophilus TaxID=1853216 RepID=UPI001F3A3FD6|nr:EAL domain-containing protein [Salinibius halmophilus]